MMVLNVLHTYKHQSTRSSHFDKACRTIYDWDHDFDLWKYVLIAWLHSRRSLITWYSSKKPNVLLNLTLLWATWSPFWNVPWSLDLVQLDLIQSNVLIPWFHFNPGRKWFYRPYESDYLLKLYETSWNVLESTMVYVVVMYSYIFM